MYSPSHSQFGSTEQIEIQTQGILQETVVSRQNLNFFAWFFKSIIGDIPSRLGPNDWTHLREDFNISNNVDLVAPSRTDWVDTVKPN